MKSRLWNSIARMALVSILPLLLLAVVAPVGMAAPEKPGATMPGKSERVNAYTLQGDTVNAGNATTVFSTTHAESSSNYGWDFIDESSGSIVMHTLGGNTGLLAESDETGIFGRANSTYGTGVAGEARTGVYGHGVAIGVSGDSSAGDGVVGTAGSAGTSGVMGSNYSADQAVYGVRGSVSSSSYSSAGGYFTATRGVGVYADSSSGNGVESYSYVADTSSVVATNEYSGSGSSYGVNGTVHSRGANTVAGNFTAYNGGRGVYGLSYAGNGVVGETYTSGFSGITGISNASSGIAYGVRGLVVSNNANSAGGYFTATAGSGIFASSSTRYGVYGNSGSSYGVYGTSASSVGVFGNTSSGTGVYGNSVNNTGVRGSSNTSLGVAATTVSGTVALRAINPNKGASYYAGYFDGNVRINGNYVATGTKSAAVPTSQGDRLMYAEESTRNLFSDQGTAQLKDGVAVIKIDPLFAQTVNLRDGYQVFVTPRSADTLGLAVTDYSATSFTVRELNKGKGSFSFDWRISALRKGYEKDRMAPAPLTIALPQDLTSDKP